MRKIHAPAGVQGGRCERTGDKYEERTITSAARCEAAFGSLLESAKLRFARAGAGRETAVYQAFGGFLRIVIFLSTMLK